MIRCTTNSFLNVSSIPWISMVAREVTCPLKLQAHKPFAEELQYTLWRRQFGNTSRQGRRLLQIPSLWPKLLLWTERAPPWASSTLSGVFKTAIMKGSLTTYFESLGRPVPSSSWQYSIATAYENVQKPLRTGSSPNRMMSIWWYFGSYILPWYRLDTDKFEPCWNWTRWVAGSKGRHFNSAVYVH